jgi:predicted TIM-barrel fold metal-dependent hydrolase
MSWHFVIAAAMFCMMAAALARGQSPSDIRELKLKDWTPKSMLVAKTTKVEKPAFPVIDAHNHLGNVTRQLTPERVNHFLAEMDAAGVRTVVNLDGKWGKTLQKTLDLLDNAHPGRFLTFTLIDFKGVDDEDWSRRETQRLEASFKAGAKGLKFHKELGLGVRYKDKDGRPGKGPLMKVDDPKLDPIFEMCAKYHRPVVIHTADPAAFFTPLDHNNERWHELNSHPGWLFYGKDFPTQKELLDQFIHLVAKHPNTTFLGAHLANNAEDLATVAQWLDKYPNLYADIDARISELGRQPYTARKFFLKYQDRITFGTDTPCDREAYRMYYRFLETDDEYFDCATSHHLQGFWMIYGVCLPKDVLEKIYLKNAERVFSFEPAMRGGAAPGDAKTSAADGEQVLRVPRTDDFQLTGDGRNEAWEKAPWTPLAKRGRGRAGYQSQIKMLYSATGVYVLFDGADRKITATKNDFDDLWTEDVFEVFLWPDESQPVYFEYEISPLGRELALLVPNVNDQHIGWLPWHYEGDRRVRKATAVTGGRARSGAAIAGWTAEIFIPYTLLAPFANVPPRPQSRWRANFYRVDYDDGKTTGWNWRRVGPSFHEFQKFGVLEFE